MELAFAWCAEETTKTAGGTFMARGLHLVTAETADKDVSWKSRGRIVAMKLVDINEAAVFKVFTEAPSATGGKVGMQRRYFLLRPQNFMKYETVDMVKKYGQAGYDYMYGKNFKFPKSTTKAFTTFIEAMGMLLQHWFSVLRYQTIHHFCILQAKQCWRVSAVIVPMIS